MKFCFFMPTLKVLNKLKPGLLVDACALIKMATVEISSFIYIGLHTSFKFIYIKLHWNFVLLKHLCQNYMLIEWLEAMNWYTYGISFQISLLQVFWALLNFYESKFFFLLFHLAMRISLKKKEVHATIGSMRLYM